MLRHIVFLKFNDQEKPEEVISRLSSMLLALPDTIEQLKKMEVGTNVSTRSAAFDFALVADFDDEAGLEAYRIHPDHVKVLDFLAVHVQDSAVVDYFLT